MLTLTEQTLVGQALATRIAVVGINPFVTAALPTHDVDFLRVFPSDLKTADQQAAFLVTYCLDSRWTYAPSLLELTLSALITAGVEAVELDQIRQRVVRRIDPQATLADVLWLPADLPFFSRTGLRPHVNSLLTADAQPILQIVGPAEAGEGCGKSYTRELLDHVSTLARTDVRSVFAAIPKGTGPSHSVEELAETLVAPTGKDITLRPRRAESNYPSALCRWVLNAAVSVPGSKWIYVLDGFNQPDVQAETRALVHALAFEIAGGEYRRRIRLVLIDYPSSLPSVQAARILRDDVPAASALTEADIVACLAAHYEEMFQRKQRAKPTLDDLKIVAQTLLTGAPAGTEKRLELLNTTLRKLRQEDLNAP